MFLWLFETRGVTGSRIQNDVLCVKMKVKFTTRQTENPVLHIDLQRLFQIYHGGPNLPLQVSCLLLLLLSPHAG